MTPYTRWAIGGAAVLAVTASVAFWSGSRTKNSVHAHGSPSTGWHTSIVFAAPGRVEGASETIDVAAAADGILKHVYVEEGQSVKRGTLLAEIACDDLRSSLQTATAETDGVQQARARLLRGTRDEERKVAGEKTAAARAVFEQAKSRLDMLKSLYDKGEISRAGYEQGIRDFGVAEADLKAAVRTEELLAAPPLEEEKARADAEVAAAEGRVRTLEERIKKCSVTAPIDGTVLRVFAKPGESFSTVTPRPLFSLADTSTRRIKAEVDERDIDKVTLGQSVLIQADALNGQELKGSVAKISSVMGRKSVFTGDPSDKSDRDVLEAVIDLKGDARPLPVGLRVTVQFLSK
jgi:HlyD family secretion protein